MDILLHVYCLGIISFNTTVGWEDLAQDLKFRGNANQSSVHDGEWAAADKALDGHLEEKNGKDFCSITRSEDFTEAWWKLPLIQRSNVAYLQIFFRGSTINRHLGFNVYVFDEKNYVPPATSGGLKVFTQNTNTCLKRVMDVNINRVTKGIALYISTDRYLSTSCVGYERYYATIEICEVKVMGCSSQQYGKNCSHCSMKCLKQECDAYNGLCIYGCSQRFDEPPNCAVCRRGYYGQNCEGTCGKCKTGTICHNVTGICPQGCQDRWNGSKCDVCENGLYGENCTKICGFCKAGRQCHAVTGVCSEGCDEHWEGYLCDACRGGFYGKHCEKSCGNCANASNCDNITGICSEGCEEPWNGTKCDECEDGFYGSSCSEVCGNCNQSTCDKTNGHCLTGCRGEWKGVRCDDLLYSLKVEESNSGIILGIVMPLVLLISVLISIIIVKRRKSFNKATQDTKRPAVVSAGECVEEQKQKKTNKSHLPPLSLHVQSPTLDSIDESVYYNTGQISDDIEIDELQNYIATKSAGEKSPFLQEYSRLQPADLENCQSAQTTENITKNRFKTTFPYEHSRIHLRVHWNNNENDYINANYIRDLNGVNRFIATQGPQRNTIEDFWRMIWQENIVCVLMLTNLVENGKNKCTQYWPNKDHPMKIGPCKVSLLDESTYAFYTVRKLSIKRQNSNELRAVTQFHYTAWPDHGTPEEIELVQFHTAVAKIYQPRSSLLPLLVHCSAGVGRTGTYIGLNVLLQQGRETGRINVFDFVKQMREDRMSMVQTVEQYVFLHKAILCGIQDIKTVISEHDLRAKVFTLLNDASPFNQQQLNKEFQLLVALKPVFDIETYEDAVKPANRTKNVDMDILPASKYRPFLTTYVRGRNDYINAFFISTFTNPLGLIVTQNPLPDTEVDVWRLCKDHDVESMVVLYDDNMGSNWLPNGGEKLQCKPFTISTKNKGFDSDGIQKDRLLISTDDCKSYIDIFRIPSENDAALLKVAKMLQEKENASTSLVISSNGAGPAGVFCVLHNALQQLRMDGEVDIFTRVRQIQTRRPEVITTLEEYRRCYQLLVGPVSSEGIYANV